MYIGDMLKVMLHVSFKSFEITMHISCSHISYFLIIPKQIYLFLLHENMDTKHKIVYTCVTN